MRGWSTGKKESVEHFIRALPEEAPGGRARAAGEIRSLFLYERLEAYAVARALCRHARAIRERVPRGLGERAWRSKASLERMGPFCDREAACRPPRWPPGHFGWWVNFTVSLKTNTPMLSAITVSTGFAVRFTTGNLNS